MDRALASSINHVSHLSVFYDIVRDRLQSLHVEYVITNLIDTAHPDSLPSIARQFDIAGIKGMAFMSTDSQRRALLKKAIQLRGKSGTPWSIKEVLNIAGFPGVTFQEGIDKYLDGTWDLDGSQTLGSEGWAKFNAVVPVADPGSVPQETTDIITAIINEYKPARCHLVEILYTQA